MLFNNFGIEEVFRFSDKVNSFFEDIFVNFRVLDVFLVKKVECIMNYDVKVIEYVFKDKICFDVEFLKVCFFVFFCEVWFMGEFVEFQVWFFLGCVFFLYLGIIFVIKGLC